jgi:hypothetical protein
MYEYRGWKDSGDSRQKQEPVQRPGGRWCLEQEVLIPRMLRLLS